MRHPERHTRLLLAWQTVNEADMEAGRQNREERVAQMIVRAALKDHCWNCGARPELRVTEPDPDMRGMTDRVRCTRCNEIQESD